MEWIEDLRWYFGGIIGIGFLWFVVTSIIENRWRAVTVASGLFLPVAALGWWVLSRGFSGRPWIMPVLFFTGVLCLILLSLPLGRRTGLRIEHEPDRVDERQAIFHRFYRIRPGQPEFTSYYQKFPEKLNFDEQVRAMPALGSPGSKTFDRLASPFEVAIFDVVERITRDVDMSPEPLDPSPIHVRPERMTSRIKGFARYLGADLVGITKLNPAFIYSHIGRSPGTWGAPIELPHPYAIAIAVRMNYRMIRHAPAPPTTTETAYQYFEAARIAMLVARYIQRLGFEARAHVDGNYRVMCVPVAADAGLGELGRIGLLITPEYGPRVRLSVVTTTLPLVQDPPRVFGVQDFCSFCRKCALNCPSGSITPGDKVVHNGVEKWLNEQESCYRFWRMNGTDCSVCVKVCPYSHPDTALHRLVRWFVRRNAIARRASLFWDDLLYGRRPPTSARWPSWHAVELPQEKG